VEKYELGFHITEDAILHSHRRDNLKPYILRLVSDLNQPNPVHTPILFFTLHLNIIIPPNLCLQVQSLLPASPARTTVTRQLNHMLIQWSGVLQKQAAAAHKSQYLATVRSQMKLVTSSNLITLCMLM
jgi:hypothetical protein